jgi:HAD superfamily hydrolase (TIGR01509 family)
MTDQIDTARPPGRRLACAECGTEFVCDLSGECWCAAETSVLPMPMTSGDCLCRDCLRKKSGVAAPKWHVEAVLLDMDGTLLDTERVYLASLNTALEALGYPDGTAIGHSMIGIPGPECESILREHFGADFPMPALNEAYIARRDEIFRSGMPLKPGAVELLDALRQAACPIALVTSSSRLTAEQHLTLGGIRGHFETMLTRDDVARGKPSPELYLLAAQRLGIRPQACIAIEDSGPGIASAHAAGTIPILVPDILPPSAVTLAKCAAVVPDLHVALATLRQRAGLGA